MRSENTMRMALKSCDTLQVREVNKNERVKFSEIVMTRVFPGAAKVQGGSTRCHAV